MKPFVFIFVLFITGLVQASVPLGCNINGIADWSGSQPFIDIVKSGREFGSPSQPWTGVLTGSQLDASGWPLVDFGFIVVIGTTANVPGTYNLRYKGASCTITGSGLTVGSLTCSGGYCQGIMTVAPTTNQIFLSFTGTTNGLKELQIWKTQYNLADFWNPDFLAVLTPFGGVLRFMDWAVTNNNPLTSWSQRSLPTDALWGRKGVPYEIQARLGNRLNRDIWINIPHLTDNNFATQLATLIQANLNANLNVYVEWSNEVWNWGFGQAQDNLQAARVEAAVPGSPLAWDAMRDTGHGEELHSKPKLSATFLQLFGVNLPSTNVYA